ncbi:MAG: hypothetical protein ABIV51_06510 [Saprospiraceae bacterium]
MIKNESGQIAENQWFWLASQYPYVILHAFVVMPDHIHGILEINNRFNVGVEIGRDLPLPNNNLPLPKINPTFNRRIISMKLNTSIKAFPHTIFIFRFNSEYARLQKSKFEIRFKGYRTGRSKLAEPIQYSSDQILGQNGATASPQSFHFVYAQSGGHRHAHELGD